MVENRKGCNIIYALDEQKDGNDATGYATQAILSIPSGDFFLRSNLLHFARHDIPRRSRLPLS